MSGARQRQKSDRIERELVERHKAIDDDRLVALPPDQPHRSPHTRAHGLPPFNDALPSAWLNAF